MSDLNVVDNSIANLLRTAFGPLGKIDQTEEEILREEVVSINSQIANLERIKNGKCLSYERPAILAKVEKDKVPLKYRLRKIDSRLAEIAEEQRLQKMHMLMAEKGYPNQLSMKPLGATKYFRVGDINAQLPIFMVSPTDNSSGQCRIIRTVHEDIFRGRYYHKTKFLPKLPKKIEHRLDEALHVIECNISASFTGHAPSTIQESIQKAKKSGLFDAVLVIAEVDNWNGYIKIDPIIAGYVESFDQLYLVGSYNLTPLEQYFQDEGAFGISKQ